MSNSPTNLLGKWHMTILYGLFGLRGERKSKVELEMTKN